MDALEEVLEELSLEKSRVNRAQLGAALRQRIPHLYTAKKGVLKTILDEAVARGRVEVGKDEHGDWVALPSDIAPTLLLEQFIPLLDTIRVLELGAFSSRRALPPVPLLKVLENIQSRIAAPNHEQLLWSARDQQLVRIFRRDGVNMIQRLHHDM